MSAKPEEEDSQPRRILAWLKDKTITQAQAYNELGCLRLAARIKELIQAGHTIKSEMITVRTTPSGRPVRVACYSLIP